MAKTVNQVQLTSKTAIQLILKIIKELINVKSISRDVRKGTGR